MSEKEFHRGDVFRDCRLEAKTTEVIPLRDSKQPVEGEGLISVVIGGKIELKAERLKRRDRQFMPTAASCKRTSKSGHNS